MAKPIPPRSFHYPVGLAGGISPSAMEAVDDWLDAGLGLQVRVCSAMEPGHLRFVDPATGETLLDVVGLEVKP